MVLFLKKMFNRKGAKSLRKGRKEIMTENDLSKIVFDLGIKVHKVLGPGLLESAYEECLYYEIRKYGLFVEKQKHYHLYMRILKWR